MFCLDREIKKYLKCMHSFFEVTQTGRTGPTTQMGQTGPMTQKDWWPDGLDNSNKSVKPDNPHRPSGSDDQDVSS